VCSPQVLLDFSKNCPVLSRAVRATGRDLAPLIRLGRVFDKRSRWDYIDGGQGKLKPNSPSLNTIRGP